MIDTVYDAQTILAAVAVKIRRKKQAVYGVLYTMNETKGAKPDVAQYRPTTSSGETQTQNMQGCGTSTHTRGKVWNEKESKGMAFRNGALIEILGKYSSRC